MNRLKTIIGKGTFFFARARVCTRTRLYKISSISGLLFLFSVSTSLTAAPPVKQAIKNLSSSNLDLCLPAIDVLGKSKGEAAAIALVNAYELENRLLVKRMIVEALGQIGRPEGRKTVVKALEDADPEIRQSAVVSLGLVGGRESDQALVKQAAIEQNQTVKLQMIHVLGRSRNPKAFDRLQQLKDDDNGDVSDAANEQIQKRIKSGVR
jgi:HEAT repeat protein